MARLSNRSFELEMANRLRNLSKEPISALRDTIRITQLEALGYIVFTVSDMPAKHQHYFAPTHIQVRISATDSVSRGFVTTLKKHFEENMVRVEPNFFHAIALEYMRMPTAYNRDMFGFHKFWSKIIIGLIEAQYLGLGSPIWVVNARVIEKALNDAETALRNTKYILLRTWVDDLDMNPLFFATSLAKSILVAINDNNINECYLHAWKEQKLNNVMSYVTFAGESFCEKNSYVVSRENKKVAFFFSFFFIFFFFYFFYFFLLFY